MKSLSNYTTYFHSDPTSTISGTVVIVAICLAVGVLTLVLAVLIYIDYRDRREGYINPSRPRAVSTLFKEDADEYENDPGHSGITQMSELYQRLDPDTIQPDAVYHNLNPNTTQPDSVSESEPQHHQPDSVSVSDPPNNENKPEPQHNST